VVLLNNQTLVLGGLIKDRREHLDRGIPWLSRIPILGYLFGAKQDKVDKTELLILITPRVIGTAADAAAVTERMRQHTPEFDKSFQKGVPLPLTSPGAAPPPASPAPPPPPGTSTPPAPGPPPSKQP
jgi:general secretion pathway protein D